MILGPSVLALCACCVCAQDAKAPPAQARVVLVKLGPITYPYIAKTAHIAGDVGVDLDVRKDGTVESAVAVSGPGLLGREAAESAKNSKFECRNCSEGVSPTHLVFTFKLADNPDSDGCGGTPSPTGYPTGQKFPVITVLGEHVTIVELAAPCDAYPAVIRRSARRAWQCVYLWHCGH